MTWRTPAIHLRASRTRKTTSSKTESARHGESFPTEHHSTAIALGSNLGDRLAHLETGIAHLREILDNLRRGPLYRTIAEGDAEQPAYFNTVVTGYSRHPPEVLLAELKRIERLAGRRRAPRNAARPLDLDLLLYGHQVADRPELTLPHPRLEHRAFVLAPLAELAPHWRVPPNGITIADLFARLEEPEGLQLLAWRDARPEGG